MRSLIALVALSSPAVAWEASRDGLVCLLAHENEKGSVLVSHDPRKPLPYAIQLRQQAEAWRDSPVFAMQFDGPGRMTITTQRHQLVDGDAELVVTDAGFENVLRGLERNFVALAVLGDQALVIPLTGAAPEVARFRACAVGAGV